MMNVADASEVLPRIKMRIHKRKTDFQSAWCVHPKSRVGNPA